MRIVWRLYGDATLHHGAQLSAPCDLVKESYREVLGELREAIVDDFYGDALFPLIVDEDHICGGDCVI